MKARMHPSFGQANNPPSLESLWLPEPVVQRGSFALLCFTLRGSIGLKQAPLENFSSMQGKLQSGTTIHIEINSMHGVRR